MSTYFDLQDKIKMNEWFWLFFLNNESHPGELVCEFSHSVYVCVRVRVCDKS
jgi:hypothetical protein